MTSFLEREELSKHTRRLLTLAADDTEFCGEIIANKASLTNSYGIPEAEAQLIQDKLLAKVTTEAELQARLAVPAAEDEPVDDGRSARRQVLKVVADIAADVFWVIAQRSGKGNGKPSLGSKFKPKKS